MRVAVTGGNGFIGQHIVCRLLELGHAPVIIDRAIVFDRPHASEFLCTNIVDPMSVEKLSAALRGVDAIIHAAAKADVRGNWRSSKERLDVLQDNVLATTTVLECKNVDTPIVFISSACVYGSRPNNQWSVTESFASPEKCESPYAASKLAGEAYVAAYAAKNGARWHVARLVNVVGAGYQHGVIKDFVEMAKRGHIEAADNGNQEKHWVHVEDVADVVVEMATGTKVPSGIYNVSSPVAISWWDVIQAMGWPKDKISFPDRVGGWVGDPVNLVVDRSKLGEFINCQRSPRDGIREALASMGWPQ